MRLHGGPHMFTALIMTLLFTAAPVAPGEVD
jgi:hypothetical protein